MKDSIIKILKENKPNNAYTTVTTYASMVLNNCERMGIEATPESIFDNYEKVLDYAGALEPKVRKNFITPILAFINPKNEKQKEIKTLLRSELLRTRDSIDENTVIGKKTPKQEEGWLDYDEIMERYHKLENEIKPYFHSDKDVTNSEFKRIQLYVLLSVCLLIPVRRSLDYTAFKLRDIKYDTDNYMNGDKFVFNRYKTDKAYGQQTETIPRKLRSIIKTWQNINPYEYLLVTNKGGPINSAKVTKMLNDFFGKSLSVSLLRHIVISHKAKTGELKTVKQRKDLATSMGHSVEQQIMEYEK